MNKHTAGPWESGLNQKGGYSNSVVVRPAGEFPHGLWIADCGNDADGERIANARLIAAAPDMLDALKGILSNPGGRCSADQWQAGLRAIAKAEGRS